MHTLQVNSVEGGTTGKAKLLDIHLMQVNVICQFFKGDTKGGIFDNYNDAKYLGKLSMLIVKLHNCD